LLSLLKQTSYNNKAKLIWQ